MSARVNRRRKPSDTVTNTLVLVALGLLLLLMLLPMILVTINTFKTEAEYMQSGPMSLPSSWNLKNLVDTWIKVEYSVKLVNSMIISLTVAAIALLLSLLNGYALGIGKMRGRTFFLIFFILAMTMPQEALVYPLYFMFKEVGLYNTRLGVIIVLAVLNSAYGTYLLASVFRTFPRELIEAGLIDGANKWQMLWRVVVPIMLPSLSVLFVFFFIWSWNEFFLPLIFLISNGNQTVPLALALARGERGVVITTQAAAAMLGILPCIIFFFLFQRTLTRGVTAGAIK